MPMESKLPPGIVVDFPPAAGALLFLKGWIKPPAAVWTAPAKQGGQNRRKEQKQAAGGHARIPQALAKNYNHCGRREHRQGNPDLLP
jgi:hypothetical protein